MSAEYCKIAWRRTAKIQPSDLQYFDASVCLEWAIIPAHADFRSTHCMYQLGWSISVYMMREKTNQLMAAALLWKWLKYSIDFGSNPDSSLVGSVLVLDDGITFTMNPVLATFIFDSGFSWGVYCLVVKLVDYFVTWVRMSHRMPSHAYWRFFVSSSFVFCFVLWAWLDLDEDFIKVLFP